MIKMVDSEPSPQKQEVPITTEATKKVGVNEYEHVCPHCGKKFKGRKNKKFCSKSCQSRDYYQKHKLKINARQRAYREAKKAGRPFDGKEWLATVWLPNNEFDGLTWIPINDQSPIVIQRKKIEARAAEKEAKEAAKAKAKAQKEPPKFSRQAQDQAARKTAKH
jgi:hypothetical protein